MHIESIMESYFYLFTCLHFGSILPIPQQDRELRRFWFRNFRLVAKFAKSLGFPGKRMVEFDSRQLHSICLMNSSG